MCRRFFQAVVRHRTGLTAAGPIEVPRVILPIRLRVGGGRYSLPIDCQWDTGSELSVVSEVVARDLGIDLTEAEESRFLTLGHSPLDAWLVPRWVRFPGLCGYQFKFLFLVQKGSRDPLPLLGMLDTHQNFEVHSREAEYFFFLADRHRGEAIAPDADC
jgi:hypothetical protein